MTCYTVRCSTDRMARSDKQLNVRLTPELRATLDAVAYLEDCSSSDLARRLVEAGLAQHQRSPAVKKAIAARLEHEALKSGKLAHIEDRSASRDNP